MKLHIHTYIHTYIHVFMFVIKYCTKVRTQIDISKVYRYEGTKRKIIFFKIKIKIKQKFTAFLKTFTTAFTFTLHITYIYIYIYMHTTYGTIHTFMWHHYIHCTLYIHEMCHTCMYNLQLLQLCFHLFVLSFLLSTLLQNIFWF